MKEGEGNRDRRVFGKGTEIGKKEMSGRRGEVEEKKGKERERTEMERGGKGVGKRRKEKEAKRGIKTIERRRGKGKEWKWVRGREGRR